MRFERPSHPANDPDPDALLFDSPNGLELRIELAPNDGQVGADMVLLGDDERHAGEWLRQAYQEHDLVLDTREFARTVFVKIELTARTTLDWDSKRARVATLLERAGDRCQELAAAAQQ